MTFGKVSIARRVSARLSQPPVTETPAKDMYDRIDFMMLPQPLNADIHVHMYGQRTLGFQTWQIYMAIPHQLLCL